MVHPSIDILMYHSISEAGGPTSIPPETFAKQMQLLADSGVSVVSMDAVLAARKGEEPLPKRSVVITFDDGFNDFAQSAWSILANHSFPALVYIPTRVVGTQENWVGANEPPRDLMDWSTIKSLSNEGVCFGSHSETHPNLDALSPFALDTELSGSRKMLEDQLGKEIFHFAPPYGRASPNVRRRIARHYATSVSTELRRAHSGDTLHNLPRLEMFYYQAPAAWKAHLSGHGGPYLHARKAMRFVRERIQDPWERT